MLITLVTLLGACVAWLRGGRLNALFDRALGFRAIVGLQGVLPLLLGVACNAVVIVANGWRMPVSLVAAQITGLDTRLLLQGSERRHVLMTSQSHVAFLGDTIALPAPFSRVVSAGDILIFIAMFLLIQELMGVRVSLFRSARTDRPR